MKNILIISCITIFLLITCRKKLDIDPTDRIDGNDAKKNVNLLLLGAYSLLGSGGDNLDEGALYGTDLILNGDLLASELFVDWRGTFNQYSEITSKSISPTNAVTVRMWRKAYSTINLCNIVLENLSTLSKTEADLYTGEALFIRGTVYFELLRFYAEPSTNRGVPILLKSTEKYEEITYPSRASIDSLYSQIIADLTAAKSLLPEDNDVYADKYAATAMLARMYLYKGDYPNALLNADEVINSAKFTLPSSVEAAFNTSASIESIFEIHQNTQNNTGTTNDGLTTFYGCDPDIPGSASRGDVQIDSNFIAQYDSVDKRRTMLIYEGTCNKASVTSGKWKNPYTNITVVRLSEMHLIRAEANLRLGSSVGASPLEDVNAIRRKAGAPEYTDIELSKVLLERELELAFEGHRIHDFKRQKKILAINDTTSVDYSGDEFIFPIPLSEIIANKNLEQNSFYR